jgi:hypothetical protein
MNNCVKFTVVALALGLASTVGHADTLNLVSVSQTLNQAGTGYIYPYTFTVNGSTSTVDLMCMDDFRDVTPGESWQTTDEAVTSSSSLKDQIAADIFSQIGKNGVTDDDAQEAVWSLFDSNDTKSAEDKKLIHDARNDIKDGNTSSFDDGQYTVYSAIDGTQNEGGTPQDFIGPSIAPAQAPEPSSLMLFGSGLVGLAGIARRKLRA